MNIDKFRLYFFVILLAAISAGFLYLISPFFMAVLIAAIFSSLFHPIYLRLMKLLGNRKTVASLLTCIIFLVLLVIPVLSILGMVANQAIQLFGYVTRNTDQIQETLTKILSYIRTLPLSERIDFTALSLEEKISGLVQSTASVIANGIAGMSMSAFQMVFTLFLVIFSMYYFLIDGENLLERLKYLSPIENRYEEMLLSRFSAITRATLKGTFILGVLQGLAGFITLYAFGVTNALFWGVVMIFLSLIPSIGTGLVWAPAGIIKLALGSPVQGIGILVVGVAVIGNIDNLLRPRLLGKGTAMHPLLILFSTLGGIVVFGMMGIIIGPLIAALFVTIWNIYGEEFKDELDAAHDGTPNAPETREDPPGSKTI